MRPLDDRWTPSEPELFVSGVDELETWQVAPDGGSIISFEKRPPLQLHLVKNWVSTLDALVPTGR